jgi:hypothetical protein
MKFEAVLMPVRHDDRVEATKGMVQVWLFGGKMLATDGI